jgi:hypothetical protein
MKPMPIRIRSGTAQYFEMVSFMAPPPGAPAC